MKMKTSKRKNVFFAGLITAALLFSMSCSLFSLPAKAVSQSEIDALQDQQDDLTEQKQDLQSKLDAANGQINSQTEQLNLLTAQLSVTNEELQNLAAQKSYYINSIAQMENELNQDKQKEQSLFAEYKVRIRAMEEGGTFSYFSIIFGATSFADLLSRVDCILEVMEYDNNLITDVKQAQKDVAAAMANMENEMVSQQAVFDSYQQKQADLLSLQTQAQAVLTSLNANSADYTNQLASVQSLQASLSSQISDMTNTLEEQKRIAAEAEAARNAAANPPPSSSGGSQDSGGGSSGGDSQGTGEGQDIVDYAESFLGVPYVYGGTSPSGFDCSGLVYYCYRHFGYSVNRGAEAQYYNGYSVSKSELQPGDLVFFSSYTSSDIEHVGIYVGGGQFIHAPHTGDVVKISNLSDDYYTDNYYGARRIISG